MKPLQISKVLAIVFCLLGTNLVCAAPKIPSQFHGTWAASQKDCYGGNQIIVQEIAIAGQGGESGWVLKRVIKSERRKFSGVYDSGGEGEYVPNITVSLRLLSNEKLLSNITEPKIFYRCREDK